MKKYYLTLALALSSICAQAQVKVYSNGNTSFGYSLSTPALSPVNINDMRQNDTKLTAYGWDKAIYAYRNKATTWGNAIESISPAGSATFSVGIRAESLRDTPISNGRSFGVYAVAGNATSGWNYSVYGRLQGENNGAAIYGTTNSYENGINTGGKYAGYFRGATKVEGNLTVTGSIDGILLGKEAATSSINSAVTLAMSENGEGLADKISALNVHSFYFPQEKLLSTQATTGDSITQTQELSQIEVQSLEKKHYGLSAEELKGIFPDLVYQQEDGSTAINYMEMIPILVQTIKELNYKISGYENQARVYSTTDVSNVSTGKGTALGQNSPNPFTASSNIALNIDTSVKSAMLFFYDMNGNQLKKMDIQDRGKSTVVLSASDFTPGLYVYALVVDGNVVATKRMIVSK